MTPAARVRALVDAASRLARRESLASALAESTGLSVEGVTLALAHHLETDATAADIAQLVASTAPCARVTVVLSANVFVGALRALALAWAAAPRVMVKPSRRDPLFARELVRELSDPDVTLTDAIDADDGELHVYGTDETIAEIALHARVPVRGHGSGLGVAWIEADGDAARLADDVVAFDQRGCLSPRAVLVRGGRARAEAFAGALHEALSASAIPRGKLAPAERAAATSYIATMTVAGRVFVGAEHAVAVGDSLVLPPPHRHVHVVPVADADEARALLEPWWPFITTVGSDADAGAIAPPWARRAKLGTMQRPPFDGPVDLRPAGLRPSRG